MSMIQRGRSKKFGFILNYDDSDNYVGNPVVADEYEPYESELFLSKIHSNSVVADVGANIGYYSMLAGLKLKNNDLAGKVIAFEPGSKNFGLLQKNIDANELQNVEINKLAVGERSGTARLFLSKENEGDHQVMFSPDREYERCKMVALDDFFDRSEQVDILKIDTQGYDFFVLKGFMEYLASNKRMKLFAEFWDYGNRKSGASSKEYFEMLKQFFGIVYHIDEVNRRVCPVDLNFIMERCAEHDGCNHVNVYCERE